jgi:hypothetical protein
MSQVERFIVLQGKLASEQSQIILNTKMENVLEAVNLKSPQQLLLKTHVSQVVKRMDPVSNMRGQIVTRLACCKTKFAQELILFQVMITLHIFHKKI